MRAVLRGGHGLMSIDSVDVRTLTTAPFCKWGNMHVWPILLAILLIALVAGFALFYAGNTLIRSLHKHPWLD
jgi:hypothetical protein